MMQSKKSPVFYKVFSSFLLLNFFINSVIPPQFVQAQSVAQPMMQLPATGQMLSLSTGFTPTMIQGITFDAKDPLVMDFIVDTGDDRLEGEKLKQESTRLIKYFLASLTVPENELWVNLSPYEKGRIISDSFGQTEMGRDLLAQDYILKQLTASLMYPEKGLGSEFWKRVHAQAKAKFGTTDIPLNTFNKIWIVPQKAVVIQEGASVYVIESHLKVMMEEDYLALKNNMDSKSGSVLEDKAKVVTGMVSGVVREVLIPEIEKEVNTGKNFANLRQIYNSMILATWYKKNLKQSLLGQVYVNKNKTQGVDLNKDNKDKEEIYNRYLEAFKKGAYNYIKEDYDPAKQQVVSQKYFSGGVDNSMLPEVSQGLNMSRDFASLTSVQRAGLERVQRGIPGAARANVRVQMVENVTADPAQLSSRTMVESVKSGIIALRTPLVEKLATERARTEKNQALIDSLQRRARVLYQVLDAIQPREVPLTAAEVQSTLIDAVAELDPIKDIKQREDIVRIWADFVDARTAAGYAKEDMDALKAKRLANLEKIKTSGADISGLPTVQEFLAQGVDIYKPSEVIFVNSSDPEQMDKLREQALDQEVFFEGDEGNDGSHSLSTEDVARAIAPTKNTSNDPEDRGPFNNWAQSRETAIQMFAKSIGQYKDKPMYVLASVAGHPDHERTFPVVQVTDTMAIVFAYLKLYNLNDDLVGQKALDKIKRDNGLFFPIYHATGDLEKVRRADDLVIENESGELRKLPKNKAVIVYKDGKPVLVNLINQDGKLESADVNTKTKDGQDRLPQLLALQESKSINPEVIKLNQWETAHKITDATDDRLFVLFTNFHDGSGNFVDQYASLVIRLINSAYGGNGIGAKKFVLRLAVIFSMATDNLDIDHAYGNILENKALGISVGFEGEFPSQVGKTNAALGEVAARLAKLGWGNITVGDDILLKVYKDLTEAEREAQKLPSHIRFSKASGENSEGGLFMVSPGISAKELKMGLDAIKKGGGLGINHSYRYYVDSETGRIRFNKEWWEGYDDALPVVEIVEEFYQARAGTLPARTGWHDWKRLPLHARLKGIISDDFTDQQGLIEDLRRQQAAKKGDTVDLTYPDLTKAVLGAFTGAGKELAQPNARYAVPISNVANWSGNAQPPFFSFDINVGEIAGKRPDTQALVRFIPNQIGGEYERLLNWSMGTAAETSGGGQLQIDPYAMKPFLPVRIGPFVADKLKKTLGLKPGARIQSRVNPFMQRDGKFLWPGFKENSRFRVWEALLYKKINELIAKKEVDNVLENVEYLRANLDPKEYQVHDLGWILPSVDSEIFAEMNIPLEDRQRLTSIDPDEYRAEIKRNTEVMLGMFKMDVPDPIRREHERRAAYYGVELPAEWYTAPSWEKMQEERAAARALRTATSDLNNPKPAGADSAELSKPVGGIDLNPNMLDLQIKRDENGITLPVFQQPIGNMKINGFFPVILNVTPIMAPLPIGMRGQNDPSKKAEQENTREPLALLNRS